MPGKTEPITNLRLVFSKGTEAHKAMDHSGATRRHQCQAALDVLGGNESPNQPQSWTPTGFGLERDRQTALLEAFANRNGLMMPIESLGIKHSGRMEHAVYRQMPFDGRAYKITKGTKFGFWPYCAPDAAAARTDEMFQLRPATPAQYLTRLITWDEITPDMTEFEGCSRLDGNFGIVTSQHWYEARNATWKEIKGWMTDLGYLPVRAHSWDDPACFYNPNDNLAIFDMSTSNVVWSEGQFLPIDIIPLYPTGELRQLIGQVLGL